MNGKTTPKPIYPREKYVIQGNFSSTSQNLHDCIEKRMPIGKFGSLDELPDMAKQKEIRGSQIW
jgi:hypothetical protein